MQLIVKTWLGKSLVLDATEDASAGDVLCQISTLTSIPSESLKLTGCGGRALENADSAAEHVDRLEVGIKGGLRGGKGGFGAMLRALAQQNTGHRTTDFGACRDLNGRRLRHVNNEIKLQKWQEKQDLVAERKRKGLPAEDDDDEKESTPSGIDGWYLNTPGWIDHVKKRESREARRKMASKRKWQDEEADVLSAGLATRTLIGSVTMVDKVNRAFCVVENDIYVPFTANCSSEDWASLKVGESMEVTAVLKPQGKNKWYAYKAQRFTAANAGKTMLAKETGDEAEDEMLSSIMMGMKKETQLKKQKKEEKVDERRKMLPVDLEGRMKGVRWGGDEWLGLLAGELEFCGNGVVKGSSEFGSLCALGVSLKTGKWYYEVQLRSSGVMQIGWADHLFQGDSANGDGVGDDVHSWAFDGFRQLKWNKDSTKYGKAWEAGDVVGCLLDLEGGIMSFSLNGESLSNAFTDIKLSGASEGSALEPGFFPASSINYGESIAVRVTPNSFKFPIPQGYSPISDAMDVKPQDPVSDEEDYDEPEASVDSKAEKPSKQSPKKPSSPPAVKKTAPTKKAVKRAPVEVKPEEINLSKYSSVEALEELGLDRLKAGLMFLGMKCGGTLQERASRLLSVKGKSKKEIDPALLAGKGKRKRAD